MSVSSIIVKYTCKCGNEVRIDGGTSDKNNGIANCVNGSNQPGLITYDTCRVTCLNCGGNMKLKVFRKEVKTRVDITEITGDLK
jgi:hypothetical protein